MSTTPSNHHGQTSSTSVEDMTTLQDGTRRVCTTTSISDLATGRILSTCTRTRYLPSIPVVVTKERRLPNGDVEIKTTTTVIHPGGRKEVTIDIESKKPQHKQDVNESHLAEQEERRYHNEASTTAGSVIEEVGAGDTSQQEQKQEQEELDLVPDAGLAEVGLELIKDDVEPGHPIIDENNGGATPTAKEHLKEASPQVVRKERMLADGRVEIRTISTITHPGGRKEVTINVEYKEHQPVISQPVSNAHHLENTAGTEVATTDEEQGLNPPYGPEYIEDDNDDAPPLPTGIVDEGIMAEDNAKSSGHHHQQASSRPLLELIDDDESGPDPEHYFHHTSSNNNDVAASMDSHTESDVSQKIGIDLGTIGEDSSPDHNIATVEDGQMMMNEKRLRAGGIELGAIGEDTSPYDIAIVEDPSMNNKGLELMDQDDDNNAPSLFVPPVFFENDGMDARKAEEVTQSVSNDMIMQPLRGRDEESLVVPTREEIEDEGEDVQLFTGNNHAAYTDANIGTDVESPPVQDAQQADVEPSIDEMNNDESLPVVPEAYLVEPEENLVISGYAEPLPPWWKNRRAKLLFATVCILIFVAAISLGVTFSREPETVTEVILQAGNTSAPTISLVPTIYPTAAPSFSMAPSSTPTECTQQILSNGQKLDLVVADPRGTLVAIDGNTIVAVTWDDSTDSIAVIFYEWRELGWFMVNIFVEEDSPCNCYSEPSISGKTAFVGLRTMDTQGAVDAGVVWVYERNIFGEWQKVDASKAPKDEGVAKAEFGSMVHLDNDLAAVEARGKMALHVFLLDESSGEWVQIEKLSFRGISSFFVDGNILVVNEYVRILLYKLDRDSTKLILLQEIILQDPSELQADGDIAAWIGFSGNHLAYSTGRLSDEGSLDYDAVFVYEHQHTNGTFTLLQKLDSSDYGKGFGRSLVIDGSLLIIDEDTMTHIFEKQYGQFQETMTWNEPFDLHQLSGTSLIATSLGDDQGGDSIDAFNLAQCTQPVPSQSPSTSTSPTSCYWVEVSITYDNNPKQTSWHIQEQIDSKGNGVILKEYKAGRWDTAYSESLCLQEGKYVFGIADSAFDGLCCEKGQGSYNLTIAGEVIVSGGDFLEHEITHFEIPFNSSTVRTFSSEEPICSSSGNSALSQCVTVECWDPGCTCDLYFQSTNNAEEKISCNSCSVCKLTDENAFEFDCTNAGAGVQKCNDEAMFT